MIGIKNTPPNKYENSEKENMRQIAILLICLFPLICISSCSPQINSTPTNFPQPTNTPESTITPTPQIYSVNFTAFHDYNGNGFLDEEEPFLKGVENKIGNLNCKTGPDGNCNISIPTGIYDVFLNTDNAVDQSGIKVTGLNFLFSGTEVLAPSQGFKVNINSDSTIFIALGQGPLVLPILATSIGESHYNGFDQMVEGHWHGALDYEIIGSEEQPIFAPWTGVAIPGPDGTWGDCNQVTIFNIKKDGLKGFDLGVALGHLTKIVVKPNQEVRKGDVIGYIDPSIYIGSKKWIACTSLPHLEIGVWGYIEGLTYNDKGELITNKENGWVDLKQLFCVKGSNNPPPLFTDAIQENKYKP